MSTSQPLLEARAISKRFGTVRALEGVSLRFFAGEIHAVLGENGAGKSTLMGILSGFVEPDSGECLFNGKALPLGRPFACRRLGIGMIHQHFTLVPEFTVAENLALSQMQGLWRRVKPRAGAQKALDLATRLGWTLDLDAKTGNLPVGAQQRIEILKVLATDAKVIIFDEPTATLSPAEINELFSVLRQLKSAGATIILIAHKLAEVLQIADCRERVEKRPLRG